MDPERDDAGLRHRLDQDHARRDRIAGEVPAVEVEIRAEGVGGHDVIVADLEDLVDEAEGRLLGDPRQDLLGRHEPMLPPREFGDAAG